MLYTCFLNVKDLIKSNIYKVIFSSVVRIKKKLKNYIILQDIFPFFCKIFFNCVFLVLEQIFKMYCLLGVCIYNSCLENKMEDFPGHLWKIFEILEKADVLVRPIQNIRKKVATVHKLNRYYAIHCPYVRSRVRYHFQVKMYWIFKKNIIKTENNCCP